MGIPKLGIVIAIDGPAGTGKSTATRRLADRLHFVHIDTGALYRAVGLLLMERLSSRSYAEIAPLDHRSLDENSLAVEIARGVHLEFRRFPEKNPANRIFANGRDLTDLIRTSAVTQMSSRVSAFPGVRAALMGLQRRLGCQGNSILEGRDIGTVIFPDADVKFFLHASVDQRAQRRLIELEAAGSDSPSFEEVRAQIIERDRLDTTRAVAPLKKAADAIELDTSELTLDQVVDSMAATIQNRMQGK